MRALVFPAILALASLGGTACLACGDAPAEAPAAQEQEQYVPQTAPARPMVLAGMGFGGGILTAGLALSLLRRRKT